MNYFFAGYTFQFGIRRISTLVSTVQVIYFFEKAEIQILEKLALDEPLFGVLVKSQSKNELYP